MCRVNYETNRYLAKQAQMDINLQYFEDDITKNYLNEIEDLISKAKDVAKNYNGYDFSEELEDMLKDMI
jgi:hypothetical protein